MFVIEINILNRLYYNTYSVGHAMVQGQYVIDISDLNRHYYSVGDGTVVVYVIETNISI